MNISIRFIVAALFTTAILLVCTPGFAKYCAVYEPEIDHSVFIETVPPKIETTRHTASAERELECSTYKRGARDDVPQWIVDKLLTMADEQLKNYKRVYSLTDEQCASILEALQPDVEKAAYEVVHKSHAPFGTRAKLPAEFGIAIAKQLEPHIAREKHETLLSNLVFRHETDDRLAKNLLVAFIVNWTSLDETQTTELRTILDREWSSHWNQHAQEIGVGNLDQFGRVFGWLGIDGMDELDEIMTSQQFSMMFRHINFLSQMREQISSADLDPEKFARDFRLHYKDELQEMVEMKIGLISSRNDLDQAQVKKLQTSANGSLERLATKNAELVTSYINEPTHLDALSYFELGQSIDNSSVAKSFSVIPAVLIFNHKIWENGVVKTVGEEKAARIREDESKRMKLLVSAYVEFTVYQLFGETLDREAYHSVTAMLDEKADPSLASDGFFAVSRAVSMAPDREFSSRMSEESWVEFQARLDLLRTTLGIDAEKEGLTDLEDKK